jgi:hypothetical protein
MLSNNIRRIFWILYAVCPAIGQKVKTRHLLTDIIFITVAAAICEVHGRKGTENLHGISVHIYCHSCRYILLRRPVMSARPSILPAAQGGRIENGGQHQKSRMDVALQQ